MEKKRKGQLSALASILIIILLGLAVYQYQKLTAVRNLQIELEEARVSHFSWTGLTVEMVIIVYNPNTIAVNVGEFHGVIYLNNIPVGEILTPPVKLLSGEHIEENFAVQAGYIELGAGILKAIKEGQVNLKVKGTYILHLPFGIEYPYTFEIDKNITRSTTPE